MKKRDWFDHFSAWFLAIAGFLYALPLVAFVREPEPSEIKYGAGLSGLMIFPCLLALYGAFAMLQDEYGFFRGWRPSWHQGLTFMWLVGLISPAVVILSREVPRHGVRAAGDVLAPWMPVWLVLIVLPWAIALVRSRLRT